MRSATLPDLRRALAPHDAWDWECALGGLAPILLWMEMGLGEVVLWSSLLLLALALIAYAIAGFWERWTKKRKSRRSGS